MTRVMTTIQVAPFRVTGVAVVVEGDTVVDTFTHDTSAIDVAATPVACHGIVIEGFFTRPF